MNSKIISAARRAGVPVDRPVRLSPPQQKALKRLTDKPQSPAWLGARESTLRSLVKLGLCQSTEEPFKPWSPFRQQVRYFLPNVGHRLQPESEAKGG